MRALRLARPAGGARAQPTARRARARAQDHLAAFSSEWGKMRCHLVVEQQPGSQVDVQKWEGIGLLPRNAQMHQRVTLPELQGLIVTYGPDLTCARMDHGTGGLSSSYHHYAAGYQLKGQGAGALRFLCKHPSQSLQFAMAQLYAIRWSPFTRNERPQRLAVGGYFPAKQHVWVLWCNSERPGPLSVMDTEPGVCHVRRSWQTHPDNPCTTCHFRLSKCWG